MILLRAPVAETVSEQPFVAWPNHDGLKVIKNVYSKSLLNHNIRVSHFSQSDFMVVFSYDLTSLFRGSLCTFGLQFPVYVCCMLFRDKSRLVYRFFSMYRI